tara:strand:- start:716 stop:1540 length:825 start_codon:yes stop_codon:yes gene_type:complete
MNKNSSQAKSQEWDQSNFEVDCSDKDCLKIAAEIFLEYGFVVLKNAIEHELIKNIHTELLAVVNKQSISNSLRDLHVFEDGTISSAHNIMDYIPSYVSLQNLENIKSVLEIAYGDLSDESFNSSYFAKPKLKGLETKAHQDNAFFCMNPADVATCWLPVSFADKRNGALYYYPTSHRLGNLDHYPEGNLGASMCLSSDSLDKINKNFTRVYIELALGDCVIHNALIAHGSDANTSNYDRNAFNFSIASIKSKRDSLQYANYQDNLSKFLHKKKL